MEKISAGQARRFRLHTHHLDKWYTAGDTEAAAGACGLQNSPPGAWEGAMQNRIRGITPGGLKKLLEEDKSLLQAWSFRGAPVVFPTAQSDVFLSALCAEDGEPWIYTRGIGLALDHLQMSFAELLDLLQEVMPKLDGVTLESKTTLDQTVADWVLPLLPRAKRDLWNDPSMYGSPDKQTVGGAAVSFLLRPCSFLGLVAFGARVGVTPSFTGYRRWVGHPLRAEGNGVPRLVRKYLHCYAPATQRGFADWLGCGPGQARRMWQTVAEEMETVDFMGRKCQILARDRQLLLAAPTPQRELHLLAGHDPYLGLRDRATILEDKNCQRLVWQTVSNPGAVLHRGGVAGIWKCRKKGRALALELTLWDDVSISPKALRELGEAYAAGRSCELDSFTLT